MQLKNLHLQHYQRKEVESISIRMRKCSIDIHIISDAPPPDLMKRGSDTPPFYADLKIIVPVIIIIILLLVAGATAVVCFKNRKSKNETSVISVKIVEFIDQEEDAKEQLDNQQNAEAQRERYYATIHKVALQAGEKIPGMGIHIY